MPRNKDLKRLVRARMRKTGEAYTAALLHIRKPTTKTSSAPASTKHVDYAALSGTSDETIKSKTGCTWERWVKALDRYGAAEMSHREIAELVSKKYKVGPWWSQTVTVGYERIKGLRARGQRRDGSYEATKSRTFNVAVKTLFDAWADDRSRARWLPGVPLKLRKASAPKSMRLGFDDGTIVAVGFASKGAMKSSVAVQHEKLADRETADRLKTFWSERLDALGEILK